PTFHAKIPPCSRQNSHTGHGCQTRSATLRRPQRSTTSTPPPIPSAVMDSAIHKSHGSCSSILTLPPAPRRLSPADTLPAPMYCMAPPRIIWPAPVAPPLLAWVACCLFPCYESPRDTWHYNVLSRRADAQ